MARNEISYYAMPRFIPVVEEYADETTREDLLARCRHLATTSLEVIGWLGDEAVWADGAELPA